MTVLARCEGAARTFGEGVTATVALAPTDCAIRPGDRIALVGPSGSGKSTLVHLLAGLDEPTVGRVERSGGRPGVVFQGPSLLAPLDVTENVALPQLLAGAEEADALAGAGRALDRLGLADLAGKLPEELSGGQAQRVAAARVLAGRPRLILADEPTGQLDHPTGTAVVQALLEAAELLGAALLLTTHDPVIAGLLPIRWAMADGSLRQDRAVSSCSA